MWVSCEPPDSRNNIWDYLAFDIYNLSGQSVLSSPVYVAPGQYAVNRYSVGYPASSADGHFASGVAATILSYTPDLTAVQLRDVMRSGADRIGPFPYSGGRNDCYGYGRISLYSSLMDAFPAAAICVYRAGDWLFHNLPTGAQDSGVWTGGVADTSLRRRRPGNLGGAAALRRTLLDRAGDNPYIPDRAVDRQCGESVPVESSAPSS